MKRHLLIGSVVLALVGCGPSAYEQAQRTQLLMKCRQASTFDAECSNAFDVVYGTGTGAKEKARLVATAPLSPAEVKQQQQDFHDRVFGKKPLKPVVLDGSSEAQEKAKP